MDYGRRGGHADEAAGTDGEDHDYRDVDYRRHAQDGGPIPNDASDFRGQDGRGPSNSFGPEDFRKDRDDSERYRRRSESRGDWRREEGRRHQWRDDDGERNYRSETGVDDSDLQGHDYKLQKPSTIIMLRMLPLNINTTEIRDLLHADGFEARDVRLMRNKSSGQSRGFAFIEFNHLQEASRWMETHQGELTVMGRKVSMHYSDPKPCANEDWLCNKCGAQNFKRREKCFKCDIPRSEAELKLPLLDFPLGRMKESRGLLPLPDIYRRPAPLLNPPALPQPVEVANDTLIIRNLGPHTTVETILSSLEPFATLSASNIRLIKDKQTQLNRGFVFIQLASIVEAAQLLQILQALQPPFCIDGKNVTVEFAKVSKREASVNDSSRAAAVASTAIAAAQWAVSQLATGGDVNVYQQGAAMYEHEGAQAGSTSESGFVPNLALGLMGAYDGRAAQAAVVSTVTEAPAVGSSALTQTALPQVGTVGNHPATPGTAYELKKYPDPDISTYQYDESSGYYYDPLTGLYYDSSSQYYYNSQTQQYMYWDGEKHTYIPAATDPAATSAAPTTPTDSSTPAKDKKDKPKNKTAQQIAKDMERWAKSLNRQKDSVRSVSALMHSRLADERRESASADAGYAVLEKKGALSERSLLLTEQLNAPDDRECLAPVPGSLVYRGQEEGGGEEDDDDGGEREEKLTDWVKLACLLCRRQFPSKEALIRHQQLSDLHKQNLEQRRSRLDNMPGQMRFRNGAGSRHENNYSEQPDIKRRKYSPM
ncbi:RNA-binding protein 10 isoform X2 [Trichomycterus rosablanca]|uniref:RNA-binding protein 10 isoform X2 n=1 Tax=Trichomycterus rosablanca TaxID=2290929 RepID=UPI002F352C4A